MRSTSRLLAVAGLIASMDPALMAAASELHQPRRSLRKPGVQVLPIDGSVTNEVRAWNAAVDAKRKAKKERRV